MKSLRNPFLRSLTSPTRRRALGGRLRLEPLDERLAPAFDLTIGTAATAGVTHDTNGNFTANAAGATVNVTDIWTDLRNNKNVTVRNANGNIVWNAGADLDYDMAAPGKTLTLQTDPAAPATASITVNSKIFDSLPLSPNSLSVVLTARNDVTVGATLATGAGTVQLQADSDGSGAGTVHLLPTAAVSSTNPGTAGVSLLGADLDIQSGATVTAADSTVSTLVSSGLNSPSALAIDAGGNLYVANKGDNTVSQVTPQGTVSTFATGFDCPSALAFDRAGNLYVANFNSGTITKVTPQRTDTVFASGFSGPAGLAFDPAGNLYVSNYYAGTVSKVTPQGVVTPFASGFVQPAALALDPGGNLYVLNQFGTRSGIVFKVTPQGQFPYASVSGPTALATDAAGNLYFGYSLASQVVKASPQPGGGQAGVTTYVGGMANTLGLALDPAGNLYVATAGPDRVYKYSAGGTVAVRSSATTRPISLGGTDNAVAGINLTDAELARITPGPQGGLTVGDYLQTGDITFTTVGPSAAGGRGIAAIQNQAGAGRIVLDEDAGGTPGPALARSGAAAISLAAGPGGFATANPSATTAELSTLGAVSLDTFGPVGSAAARLRFDATSAPAWVIIGATRSNPVGAYLVGQGGLTLAGVTAHAAPVDVTAGSLTVAGPVATGGGIASFDTGSFASVPGGTINAGSGSVTIAADAFFGIGAAVTGNGGITIRPKTANGVIALNNFFSPYPLRAADLTQLNSTGTVTFGSPTTTRIGVGGLGAIDLSGGSYDLILQGSSIDFHGDALIAPTNKTITLTTGTVTHFAAGIDLVVGGPAGTLRLNAGSVGTTLIPLTVSVTNLGAGSVTGSLYLASVGPGLTTTGTTTVGRLASLTAAGDFTTHPGDLAAPSLDVTMTGAGDQTLTTNGTVLTSLTHTGTGNLTVADNLTLTGGFTNKDGAGDVDITRRTVTVGGDWRWGNSGVLVSPFSSAVLNGANQSISGNTSFNDLTKTTTAGDTLTFQTGSTQTVAGALTLQGTADHPLVLRSSSAGTSWNINPHGYRRVAYADVRDGSNQDAQVLTPSFSTDSGNNTNWDFTAFDHPPTLSDVPPSATVDEQTAWTFTATATDPDGQPLQFALRNAPVGATIDPTTGEFAWTPTEDQGPATFLFDVTVSDGIATTSQSVTVTVNEVNSAPTLADVPTTATSARGAPLVFTATATDADRIDCLGNALTFSLVGAPAGAMIDPDSGAFNWIPAADLPLGDYTFKVRVADDGVPALSDSKTITVTVTGNSSPTLAGVPGLSAVDELTPLTFTAQAFDLDAGQTLTLGLANAPAGASIDPATGVFSWTPTEDQAPATYQFDVTATDGTATARLPITVVVNEVNSAPTLGGVPATVTTAPGSPVAFTAASTDPDRIRGLGNTLTYSLVGAPVGAVIDPDTGAFSWTPDSTPTGNYTFKVRVADDGVPSLSDTKTITVSVKPAAVVNGDLLVGGTSGNDAIAIAPSKDGTRLVVTVNRAVVGSFPVSDITGKIIVHGLSGNDTIAVSPKVTRPAWLFGEGGNDKLTGGGGSNLLVGGDGNDILSAKVGTNMLIGGAGADRLTGGTGDDLLIGGSTAFDTDPTGLAAVFAEWTSGTTYADRVAHLTGTPGGVNGGIVLDSNTLTDDGLKDRLTGGKGSDWFVAAATDTSELKAGELKLTV
jgi:hypothetical protein